MSLFRVENQEGKPVKVGDRTITPIGRSFRVTIPGFAGGLIWNRPLAVRVQTAEGGQEQIPIQDVTQWVLLGSAALILLAALISVSRK